MIDGVLITQAEEAHGGAILGLGVFWHAYVTVTI
jgi:hypothetical protein